MRLHLIRHGQSRNNAEFARTVGPRGLGYPGRVPDPELTALGHRQAATLADAVRAGRTPLSLTHLYSSLTVRAVQTVAPLADALDLPVVLRDDAYEVGGVHHHDLDADTRHPVPGRSVRELSAMCPSVVAPSAVDPDVPWHGGFETVDDALPRARRLLADLCAAHAGTNDVVGLVSHQHFGQFVLAAVLGLGGPPWRRFRIDNTAHVAIDFSVAQPQIEWVNRSDHLSLCDVTN
jgi:2,3-bisphosphoglycerate-dependent phosphoglycerate mutase